MIFEEKTKPLPITKQMVWEAYKLVKKNRGSSGVDQQTLEALDSVRSKQLYKVWNRLASGSYFPSAVKHVSIDKGDGKKRPLGIPTVCDRVAQQVVKSYLETKLDALFASYSYGYRPNKSAHQAVEQVRTNTRKYHWVIDLDIENFFENVSHDLLMKALAKHVPEKWVKMYILRWLEAPVQMPNGELVSKQGKGVPQGGVISPLLANLYLHYSLDKWMEIHYPQVKMVRYADDVIVHCRTHQEAENLLASISTRLSDCCLSIHPQKTQIVYCKKDKRNNKYTNVQFDFLGFSFQPLRFKLRKGGSFLQFDCKMSRKSKQRILKGLRSMSIHNWTRFTLQDIASFLNPKIRGWIGYYGKISRNALKPVFYHLHHRIIKWVLKKYKRFKGSRIKAVHWLRQITKSYPNMFYHWSLGYQLT